MPLTPNQLRQKYLDFFKARGHVVIPSASLVPENDPTTLFTGSGMQPILPYLLGEKHPQGTRLVDSQKSFRTQDIEEVGDNRHTTFFEMLGNWSLGDYFKKEQLEWCFEFLVDECGLAPEKLFVTVYQGNKKLGIPRDDVAVEIWQKLFASKNVEAEVVENAEKKGLQNGRIFYYGNENWWSRVGEPANMPVGEPGGPDSEVFYDFGLEYKFHESSEFANLPCHVNCDCGRFLEIGNNVFMAYVKTEKGFEELENKNIDFGGGFERILAAMNNDPDVFKTELFSSLISKMEKMSGKQYGDDDVETQFSMRVILDHVRAAVMLAADGVFPSNKEQGYFVRRLLRRAIRHGRLIGIENDFIAELVPVAAEIYSQPYPKVKQQVDVIKNSFAEEEVKFSKALGKGMNKLKKLDELNGESAFWLYETYGFPLEMSVEEAASNDIKVEKNIFNKFDDLKKKHAQKSRQFSADKFKGGLAEHSEATIKYHTATHLLHAALREVLGDQVQQQGSNITAERLRFDFSYPRALTDQEKQEVENLVNDWIKQSLPVTKQVMSKQEALDSGAIAFFKERYSDQVSVYTVGEDPEENWVSKELCGGPHVKNTVEIGQLEIFKEKSASAGVRRIYARIDSSFLG